MKTSNVDLKGLRRIVYKDWFIQSRILKNLPQNPPENSNRYLAWASVDRVDEILGKSVGDVYFDFGKTEDEAIQKVKDELDALMVNQEG